MQNSRLKLIFSVLMIVAICSLVAVAATEVTPKPNAEVLLEERCAKCHSLNKVYSGAGEREEWEAILDRMISKGAKLNANERLVVLDYLAPSKCSGCK